MPRIKRQDRYNPRIDIIIGKEGKRKQWVIHGKPTAGARLDNLLGAPLIPRWLERRGWKVIHYVIVPPRVRN